MARIRLLGSPKLGWRDARGRPWIVHLHWAEVDGRAECIGIDMRSFEAPSRVTWVDPATDVRPVTASLLRQLPLGHLIDKQRKGMVKALDRLVEGGLDSASEMARARDDLAAYAKRPASTRQSFRDDDHFRQVADVYRKAWEKAEPPTQAVRDRFVVQYSTAAKWVMEARRRGLLPKTSRGVAAGGQRKRKRRRAR